MKKAKGKRQKGKGSGEDSDIEEGGGDCIVYQAKRPGTKGELHSYVREHLAVDVPCAAVCAGHDAPMDYLWHSYSADFANLPEAVRAEESADCIVWAGRGGGKTRMAAIATLLDCVFKPGCRVRILAGSLEQSSLMYDYFSDDAMRDEYRELLEGKLRVGRCRFQNGSEVRLLSHSVRDVRGVHIHKLRCDEAELFREDVFKASQFITKSREGIRGAMEVFSTMHQPYGVMQRLIDGATESQRRVFRWCVWEAIERCMDRECSQCPLWGDCAGKAKNAAGYLKIDDVIDQMRRSSRAGFESEMLCLRPRLDGVVFDTFNPDTHVRKTAYNPELPLYLAMDFGYSSPFVCLWVQVGGDGTVRVIDEYMQTREGIVRHGKAVLARTPGGVDAITKAFCDPAGAQHSQVTGTSPVEELKALGIQCLHRPSMIDEGVELVRAALKAGDHSSKLLIDPKCGKLIEAMRCYHYPANVAQMTKETPKKDGVYDHPIDALRYFFVNYLRKPTKTGGRY